MVGMTRKRFLRYGGAGGAALFLPWAVRPPAARAAKGGRLAKYLEPVPLPGSGHRRRDAERSQPLLVHARPRSAGSFIRDLPPTPLWAYDDGSGLGGQAGSFGMAVVAQSGTPLTVDFTHALPATYPTGCRSTRA